MVDSVTVIAERSRGVETAREEEVSKVREAVSLEVFDLKAAVAMAVSQKMK